MLTRRELLKLVPVLALLLGASGCRLKPAKTATASEEPSIVKLPQPKYDSQFSLEKAVLKRRSIRSYAGKALALDDISQLLWAAQGITYASSLRTAPSAGATYPLQIYLVAGSVTDLSPGIYKYDNQAHALTLLANGDQREELAEAALGQSWVVESAMSIVITAVYERTTRRYGERGERYVHMEAGHVSQNIYLQAAALGLGTVAVGAFDDASVIRLLRLLPSEEPLYIMPVGKLTQENQIE